ncbi:MAG: hypothetical protein JXB62_07035 [Pirellulales bacterium]|nr:hypothetical protein [Pirellulales bacterium]
MLLVVGSWLALLGVWIALGKPYTWSDWMLSMTLSKRSHGPAAVRSDQGGASADETYLGDGHAKLGWYAIKIFDPVTQITLQPEFQLEGHTACGDSRQFGQFMKSHYRLFREQVAIAVRTCDFSKLTEEDLPVLGRKIAARVNRTLDREFLESVEIKDFALYESVDRTVSVRWAASETAADPKAGSR